MFARHRATTTAMVVLAMLSPAAPPAQAPTPQEASQLTTGEVYDTAPRYSPDGKTIAFTRRLGGTQGGSATITLMNSDGTDPRTVTSGESWDAGADWSPDGRRLAFSSDRAGSRDIWVMDLATGDRQRITSMAGNEEQPDWSPDGGTIAFHADEAGNFDVWAVDLESRIVTPLTAGPEFEGSPRYSPDGREIVFRAARDGGNTDLFLMDAAGELGRRAPAQRLTTDPAPDWNPAWFPDGSRISYTSRRGQSRIALWSVTRDGRQHAQLTPELLDVGLSEPSPDGRALAYQIYENREHVYRLDRSTGQITQLTTGGSETSPSSSMRGDVAYVSGARVWVLRAGASARATASDDRELDPAWLADGTRLAFVTIDASGDSALVVRSTNGAISRIAVGRSGLRSPRWCEADRLVVTAQDTSGVAQVWSLEVATGEMQQLTRGVPHTATDCSAARATALVTRGATVNPDVHEVSLAGGAARLVEADAHGARYGPEGQIVFLSNREGDLEIFVRRGDLVSRITDSPGNETSVDWSGPSALVYARNMGHSHLWVRSLE